MDLTSEIKGFCRNNGADLVGIADLEPLKKGLPVIPESLLDLFTYGVSIGIRLKDEIIEGISSCPTPEYAQHYRNVNMALDGLASLVVQWIAEKGFNAKAVPASQIVDETDLLGNISHKAVARIAGLGWQGKSLLIINPEFGPRFRLATVLTDMPLKADGPVENRCGECMECVNACPASAIRNAFTDSHYACREVAVDLEKCNSKLFEFKVMPGIGARICGVCIKVCPYGKQAPAHTNEP